MYVRGAPIGPSTNLRTVPYEIDHRITWVTQQRVTGRHRGEVPLSVSSIQYNT